MNSQELKYLLTNVLYCQDVAMTMKLST